MIVAACSGSQPTDNQSGDCTDGCDDAATPRDSAPDATDGACNALGASACNTVLQTLCFRIVQCCTASDAPPCQSWAYDPNGCLANYVAMQYDCAAAPYVARNVCPNMTTTCVDEIPAIACSDIYGQTANWPGSCTMFWLQYK
jgi:hypothetical protein